MGDSLQGFVPGYLDMSMDSFTKNQEAMRNRIAEAFGGGSQVIETITRQNLAMFERAMQMFSPFAMKPPRAGDEEKANGTAEARQAQAVRRHQRAQERDRTDAPPSWRS